MIRSLLRILETASHITLMLFIPLLAYRIGKNLGFLRAAKRNSVYASNPHPRVSILVPARNEASNIERCIRSLLEQDYPNFEIIVLDDASTDATGAIVDHLAMLFPVLKVLHSKEIPPPGWNGKSYACHRLAQAASGTMLLFTDADTIHNASSLSSGIAYAQTLGVTFLSVFPYQITEGWSERLLVSFIVDFMTILGFDLKAMLRDPEETAANGQYVLVRKSHYDASGGHAAIYSDLLDDFALAQQFKRSGYQAALVDGSDMLSCRMYHSPSKVWNGFAKNLLLGLEQSQSRSTALWKKILFPWVYVCGFLFPYLWLFVGQRRWWALAEVGCLSVLRGLVSWQFKRPISEIVTTPAAALGVMTLGLYAGYQRLRKQTVIWKDRSYLV